ncbi:MAG: hypothetical protein IT336_04345 [Thermomicrobiales bacterium]|nr:hypothetical protein [Thermomicrobiales bacterium]
MNKRIRGYGTMRLIGLAVVLAILAGMGPNRASAAQGRGDSYTSPSFGFTVSWDDAVWEGEETDPAEGVQLASESSFAIIQAVEYEGDAVDCVADSVTSIAGGDDVFDFGKAPKRLDRPATARDAEGELFTYVNAEETEIAMYVECRDIGADAVLLQSVLVTVADVYEDVVGEWEAVLGDIEIDDAGSSNSRDEDDDRRDDDNGSAQSGLDGDVYYMPDYGFSLTFDEDDWAARELEEEEELGVGVEVSTEATIGWVTVGDALSSDFEDCAVSYGEGISEYEAITKFKKASKKFDLPETDRDAVSALYTFTQELEDGPVKMVGYFECRELDDDMVASIFLATTQETYEDELPLWEDLLSGIEIDAAGSNDEDTDEPANDDDTDEPARDDDDDTDEPVARDAAFVGPNFGFSVALDESVWSYEDLSDNGNDFLSLESEFAIGTIIGYAGAYDAASCMELLITLKVGEDAASFEVAPESMERPKTARGATGELFLYSFQGESGLVEVVMWVECRELAGGEANLGLTLSTVPAVYEDALPEFEAVLGGIETSQEA